MSSIESAAASADSLSEVFLALADPTRRAMLAALTRGDLTLTELASPLPISVPAVTKHLRILERAGLISRGRQAQRKPCTLRVEPLSEAARCIAQYRAEWAARLDRLDEFLLALQAEEDRQQCGAPIPAATAHSTPTPTKEKKNAKPDAATGTAGRS